MRITKLAPAKLNLDLYVTGRRADGYHLLDSIMTFTQWGDQLVIEPSEQLSLAVSGPQSHILTGELLSTERNSPNLVIKAVYAMADAVGRGPNVQIHLEKNIPSGAGLGGGSSDAAATMHALNELWGHALSLDELCTIGLQFGAEIPVCLRGQPTRVQGIGEVMTSVDIPQMNIVIAWPDQPLMTADVFQAFKNKNCDFDDVPKDRDDFKNGKNSLTQAAISLCPDIKDIIDQMANMDGCEVTRMTGAGSACFGIFKTNVQAEKAVTLFENSIWTIIDGD